MTVIQQYNFNQTKKGNTDENKTNCCKYYWVSHIFRHARASSNANAGQHTRNQ